MKKLLTIAIFLACFSLVVVPLVFAVKPTVRAAKACSDGIDNDGDGYTDFPSDPGCANKNDKSELNPNIECDDGSDNDGDGNTDMDDAGCSSPSDDDETNCGDNVAEGGETCDGTDLGGETCSSQGHDGGDLACNAQCDGFDTSSCWDDSCSDTDGGFYAFTFGTTSGDYEGSPYSNDDYCVDSSNVMEYYCSGDYSQSTQSYCGTDYYSNTTYCIGDDVYWNFTDFFCSSGACDSTITPELKEECDYGCTNGECDGIPDSCSDTDGGYVIDVLGTVSGYYNENPYSYQDNCTGPYLIEYYCSGDIWYDDAILCSEHNYTGCSNGACY